MDELINREDILKRMNIAESQFKAFRRYGLIDGYVKKISKVALDDQKTAEKGKKFFRPAGFDYFYPTSILTKIKWILGERAKGKNLMQIQGELIRTKIAEEEKIKQQGCKYEKHVPYPIGPNEGGQIKTKLVKKAIYDLTSLIKEDYPERKIKTLVFIINEEEQPSLNSFQRQLKVHLDMNISEF